MTEETSSDHLYHTAMNYWSMGEEWRRKNAALIATVARDAIQEYGVTNPERRVELQAILDEVETLLPPRDFRSIPGLIERAIVRRIATSPALLLVVGVCMIGLPLYQFTGKQIAELATYLRNYYVAMTRQDIRLLRVGSPFDDSKPPLSRPDFSGLIKDSAVMLPSIVIESSTAQGMLEYAEALKAKQIRPEIVAFDNYGVFEPSTGVPYKSTTIREAFANDNFIAFVGPAAKRIQSFGWVFINQNATNAQFAINLALSQVTCEGKPAKVDDNTAKLVLAPIAKSVKDEKNIDICLVLQRGDAIFAVADVIVESRERVGLLTYSVILAKAGESGESFKIASMTDDGISACYLGVKMKLGLGKSCDQYVMDISNAVLIPELPNAFGYERKNEKTFSSVRILSQGDMVNLYNKEGDITWSEFKWQTIRPGLLAFQVIIFSIDGKQRFFVLKPVELAAIPSGNVYDGDDKKWRIMSVAKSGRVSFTDWRAFGRFDLPHIDRRQ